jgi:hypothetical protein
LISAILLGVFIPWPAYQLWFVTTFSYVLCGQEVKGKVIPVKAVEALRVAGG